jgi:hypothetical protein
VFGQIWTKFGKCRFMDYVGWLCVWIVLEEYLINAGFGKSMCLDILG